jgi:hypothetical protein
MIRNAHYVREGTRTVEIRSLKNFNRESFLEDLEQKQWDNICCSQDHNEIWEMWKNMLMATIEMHAPLRYRRTRKRKSPWITNELKRRIYNREYT